MRRWLLPVGLYAAIAVAFSLPLLPHFGSAVAHDAGDPILVSWILWWSTQKLPLTSDWWNAPMFYPMHGAMALSELLIGLLPISAPVQFLTGNPLAAYNTAFALSFILTALGGYALALELTGRRDAATVSGIAFAFAPYKMGQLAHLQMLAYFAMPVGLLALHRFIRTRALRSLSLFAAAWLL